MDMDFSNTHWPYVGMVIASVILVVFAYYAYQLRWSWGALLVAVAHLPVAAITAVVPFRGLLDPSYPGWEFGLLRAEGGIEILFGAGAILVGAITAMAHALINRPGWGMAFVFGYDSVVLVALGPPFADALVTGDVSSVVQIGGVTLEGVSALIAVNLFLLLPIGLSFLWAWQRIHQDTAVVRSEAPTDSP